MSAITIIQNTYGDCSDSLERQDSKTKEVFTTQAIGFFNLGVELEHLKYFEESISSYQEALKLSEMCGMEDQSFISYVKQSIKCVEEK